MGKKKKAPTTEEKKETAAKEEEEPKAKESEKKGATVEEKVVTELPSPSETESDVEAEKEAEEEIEEPERAETLKSSVTLSWRPPRPKKVFVAGDFYDWNTDSHPLTLDENGEWKIELELTSGTYEYCFVVNGKWILDPTCETSVKNPFGSYNSVLTVK